MSKKRIALIIVVCSIFLFVGITLSIRFVAFREADGKIVFNKASSNADSRIYITSAMGFPTTPLSAKGEWDVDAILSPDGTKIAFECQIPDVRLCIMNSDGAHRVRVPQAGNRVMFPNWSQDSQKITFESGGIFVVDVDGSSLIQLTKSNDRYAYWESIWSPDGRKIAYVVIDGDNWEIYTMNSDGTEQTNVTNHSAGEHSPVWSPDGEYIFFVSDRSGDDEIYRMKYDGSNVINLTNSSETDDELGSISPDGKKIVFSVHDHNLPPHEIDVFVMNIDGSGRERLTETPGYDSKPVWGPNGKHIAFISGRKGDWAVYIMQANGKFQTRISYGLAAQGVSWQP